MLPANTLRVKFHVDDTRSTRPGLLSGTRADHTVQVSLGRRSEATCQIHGDSAW